MKAQANNETGRETYSMRPHATSSPVRDPVLLAAKEVDSSLDEFTRQLGLTQAFIHQQLLEFAKDSDNGHLFAIIHALKELLGMQAQPAAKMANHISVLQQAAAAEGDGDERRDGKPRLAPVLQLETSVLLPAHHIDEAGRGHNPRVERMKDWGKTSYELEIARESGDLDKRMMALQAGYDLARQACSTLHNLKMGAVQGIRH